MEFSFPNKYGKDSVERQYRITHIKPIRNKISLPHYVFRDRISNSQLNYQKRVEFTISYRMGTVIRYAFLDIPSLNHIISLVGH
jgi:hypothetical protein